MPEKKVFVRKAPLRQFEDDIRNMTSDGWFLDSWNIYTHYEQGRVQSAEYWVAAVYFKQGDQ